VLQKSCIQKSCTGELQTIFEMCVYSDTRLINKEVIMKQVISKLGVGLTIASTVFILSGCGGDGVAYVPAGPSVPLLGVQTNMAAPAQYMLVLVNAADGTRITDNLNVTITGSATVTNAADAVLNGQALSTNAGFIAVGATFTTANNEFSVLVGNRSLGWIETGKHIIGDPAITGIQTVTLQLSNINQAAAINASTTNGMAMAVSTATPDATGAIPAVTQNTTAPGAVAKTVVNAEGVTESVGAATLSIPAGTQAVDPVTGAVIIPTGSLTISSTKFSNASNASMSAFPGGFDVTAVTSGVPSTGRFITGGFAQFNVTDATGKALKQFNKPLSVSIDLPKGSQDATGKVLIAGDIYPVWSFNDVTGQWTFEQNGIVAEKTPVDPNLFSVNFTTSHLSSWNLDYHDATVCRTGSSIVLTGKTDTRPLKVELTGLPGRRFSFSPTTVPDTVINIWNTPRGSIGIKVYDGTTVVGSNPAAALCSATGTPNTITIALTGFPARPAPTPVTVDVSESCSDGSNKRAIPTWVYAYTPSNWSSWFSAYASSVLGTTVARAIIPSVSAGTTEYIYAFNMRTWRWEMKTVVMPTPALASTVPFNFTMTCKNVAVNPTGATAAKGL
jgi:hypothetical protein